MERWEKKAKWLTQALIISGTLNVGLVSTFIYFSAKDTSHPISQVSKSEKKVVIKANEKGGLQQVLTTYSTLTFQDLLYRLSNDEHIESGYTRRDLVLASLVAHHHFHIEKALGGLALQKREITYTDTDTQEKTSITVFPGLADYQYEAIINFAKTETWPLTPHGLWLELQKSPNDSSLVQAFALTPEVHYIDRLFSRTGLSLKQHHIAALLVETPWETLAPLTAQIQQNATFTIEERRAFLLALITQKSPLAAKILMETDADYCTKTLSDDQILFLCDLLQDNSSPSFLKTLLMSPRSDAIWQKAASLLYTQAAEEIPATLDKPLAIKRFIELKDPMRELRRKTRTYIVAPGDSLWKIARNHSTTVERLRTANNLTTNTLRVGQELQIP